MRRVIWIVLDSVGMGEAPDAADFDDVGCNTIGHIMEAYPDLKIPNMRRIGYGNIDGMQGVKPVEKPEGAFGRLKEMSAGKDTTIGHWEMVGIYTPKRLPVYPDGFPQEIIDEYVRRTGVPGILYNGVASGTAIINELGEEHRRTRKRTACSRSRATKASIRRGSSTGSAGSPAKSSPGTITWRGSSPAPS